MDKLDKLVFLVKGSQEVKQQHHLFLEEQQQLNNNQVKPNHYLEDKQKRLQPEEVCLEQEANHQEVVVFSDSHLEVELNQQVDYFLNNSNLP